MTTTRVTGHMIGANTITSNNIANGTITSADLSNTVSLGTSFPSITSIVYPGDDTAANTAGGQTITIHGSGFNAGAYVLVGNTTVSVVTVSNSSTISFTSPAKSAGSYLILVVNTDGSVGAALPGIQYSGTPTWTTASGSLGTQYEYTSFTIPVAATSDSNITYTVASGSLPPNTSLNSNGTITGTLGSVTQATYSFVVAATDVESQSTDRSFSISVDYDSVTWNAPANNTTYNVFTSIAISNVSLNATSIANHSITYTANSLPAGLSLTDGVISGTPTAVGNSSSLITATAALSNKTATDTINWYVAVPFIATGGTETTVSGYKYHTFTTSGTFAVTSGSKPCDILVVGGGGAACGTDGNGSGGGGAGGWLSINAYSLGVNNYSITIGAGGPASPQAGANGTNTTFSTLFTALGGGGGGGRYPNEGGGTDGSYGSNGRSGGSGGGGGFGHPGGSALQPTSTNGGYGNRGGHANTYVYSSSTGTPGGGGGGAGANGTNTATTSPYSLPGNGGIGKQWFDGNYYAGGGGGGSGANVTQGLGGTGGGANGVYNASGLPGTAGTGGGGGGTGVNYYNGGQGGSGVVIVRYAV